MSFKEIDIQIEDAPLTVEYAYHPGCPQTVWDPGEPEEVETQCIYAGDVDIALLLDEDIAERIQSIVLDKIKRGTALDEGEARYEQREADRELV